MKLRDIMANNVITVTGDTSVAVAARRMREASVGCLVVANAKSVQGIVTDRDLAIRCLGESHNSPQCQVSHHMSAPVTTAGPDMDILEAAHLMTAKQIKRLPVVENGQLVGLTSFSDIAQALDRPMHDVLVGMGAARRAA